MYVKFSKYLKKNIYIILGMLTFHSSFEKKKTIWFSLACFVSNFMNTWILFPFHFNFDFNLISGRFSLKLLWGPHGQIIIMAYFMPYQPHMAIVAIDISPSLVGGKQDHLLLARNQWLPVIHTISVATSGRTNISMAYHEICSMYGETQNLKYELPYPFLSVFGVCVSCLWRFGLFLLNILFGFGV